MKANANKTNIKLMGLYLTGHGIRHQNAVFYCWSSYAVHITVSKLQPQKQSHMKKQLISLINFLISPSLPFARDTNYKLHPVNSHLTRVPSSFLLLICVLKQSESKEKRTHAHTLSWISAESACDHNIVLELWYDA